MTSTTTDSTHSEPRVDQLISHYGESHQNPPNEVNEVIHFIAIALIMLSLVGMLFALHRFVAYAFVAASMVYYVRLSGVFFVSMVLCLASWAFAGRDSAAACQT